MRRQNRYHSAFRKENKNCDHVLTIFSPFLTERFLLFSHETIREKHVTLDSLIHPLNPCKSDNLFVHGVLLLLLLVILNIFTERFSEIRKSKTKILIHFHSPQLRKKVRRRIFHRLFLVLTFCCIMAFWSQSIQIANLLQLVGRSSFVVNLLPFKFFPFILFPVMITFNEQAHSQWQSNSQGAAKNSRSSVSWSCEVGNF